MDYRRQDDQLTMSPWCIIVEAETGRGLARALRADLPGFLVGKSRRMKDLIRKGKQRRPPRVVVYGKQGEGKSTFGASAPRPIFLPTEDGLGEIDCESFPLADSYQQFVDYLGFAATGKHEYETVIVDTLDWLERLIWASVCKRFNVTHIEKADGGYARGYKHALTEWKEVLEGLTVCRDRGMAVILLAHAKVEKFEDPESQAYDRYTLRLHKDADGLVQEWADAVLFATRKFRVQTEDAGFNRTRGIAKAVGADGGERVLRCVGSPSCSAKNRFGITGEIPLSWESFAQHLNTN